ncbi:pyruvate dehydrogenase [Kytococcus sedentarius]|uniref:pyruvate dehydrogenase n=1 Tax=Kytococcus sedentarius TaxID=1276 RepID=UPI0006613FBA|nr:pyruvate dehydrogenase [Kytococcus sedentarius]
MNVAEQIVTQLVDAGVHRIYGIVGDSLNPIVDAVRKTGGSKKGGIDWIHVRHEESAAFAASAEAQLTGKLAVCAGSCGPGNLHLINGLYDANRTGAPVLAIASHIPSVQIGSMYFQETHPDRIFEECSVYNELISSAAQSPRTVNSAIRHAVGLGGVAVITLPGDVSDLKAVEHVPTYAPARPATLAPNAADIEEAATLLNQAEKVAIFAGAGVEGAHDEVIALADALKAPIGHSLRGKHFIQYDNPFDVGMTGLLGYGAAAEGMNDADVLILLGTDFPYDQFLPSTPTIQVDTHAEKLGRRTDVGLAIHAQVKPFIEALLPHLRQDRSDAFLTAKIKKHSEIMHAPVGAYTRNVEKMRPIHPEYAAHLLNKTASKDAIVTADTGMCNVWTARYIDPLGTRRLIGSLLHGSMANALPMALGAQVAYPERQVVSVSGDGGLSMLLGELITAKMYGLPVKVVVFNNSTLGMVKLEMLVNGLPDFQTDVPNTNYADIARAIGFHAERVEDASRLEDAYREAFAAPGPALVEVITDPNALSLPPAITGGQVVGFATAMSKIVLNRGIAEAFSMATSNMRNIPRL